MRPQSRRNVPRTFVNLPELGADTLIYGEIDDPDMRDFNPSIAWHNGKLQIAIRRCNFAIKPTGSFYFRDGSAYSKTDVMFGDVDPNTLQVSNIRKLNLVDAPVCTQLAGLEDVRLFSRKDGLHAIGFESDRLTRSLHNESASMAEYLVKGDDLVYIRTLPKPRKLSVEKNWSPTDTPSNHFDCTYSDTQVYKDGKLYGKPSTTQIHGGSQLLKQKDGYLSLVHEKITTERFMHSYDRFTYIHYLAKHNDKGFITHLSKGFRFGTNEKIEFGAGMVEHKGNLLISFGIRDAKWGITRINKDKLMELFV